MKLTTIKKGFLNIFFEVIIYVLILLSFSVKWCTEHFGNISMSEIVFTLNMPLKGTPNEYFHSYISAAFVPSLIGYILLRILCILLNKALKKSLTYSIYLKFKICRLQGRLQISRINHLISAFTQTPRWLFPVIWLMILIFITNTNYQLIDYLKSSIQTSSFIENEYVNINDIHIEFPEEKKNLICIYVESAETTFQDRENGGVFDENIRC